MTVGISILCSLMVGVILTWQFSNQVNQQAVFLEKAGVVAGLGKGTAQKNHSPTPVKIDYSNKEASPITNIASKIGPSIVGIRTTVANTGQFFGRQSAGTQAEGSGIIISKDGYIATNFHVVEGAQPGTSDPKATIEVFLPDKRQAKAEYIGGDSINDLAVLKIKLNNLPVAELGDSSQLNVGDLAVAIGNPLGMEFMGSVTSGIISALNRSVNIDDKTLTLIQTDAAINPGNSGGALVNSQGQVVGINTVKIAESGVEGLGFAIPINTARPVINQLILYGYVKGRPLVGISGQDITDILSQYYHLPAGIFVTGVTPGTGAEKAGLRRGDIIISMAGKTVKNMSDLENIKKAYKAGDTVNVGVERSNQKVNLKLIFSEER